MGAAASVKDVYVDSLQWFREYFDTNLYLEDFQSIDKDHDGGITFGELRKWLMSKASDGKAWKLLMSNEQVMVLAHQQASKYSKMEVTSFTSVVGQKIVDVADFRAFLIQLFAISLMWVHFKNADSWLEGNDAGNGTLSLAEFKLACRSFCMAHQQEEPSDEQMAKDFKTLDFNNSNSISFAEICNYCCQFVDPMREDALALFERASKEEFDEKLADAMNACYRNEEVQATLSTAHQRPDFDERNNEAIDALVDTMNKNLAIAEFVEIKVNTQLALGIEGSNLMVSPRKSDSATTEPVLSSRKSPRSD